MSSAILLSPDIIMAMAETYSATWSREPVASRAFSTMPSNPSSLETWRLSMFRLVPPTAPAPNGHRLMRVYAEERRSTSRMRESIWAII